MRRASARRSGCGVRAEAVWSERRQAGRKWRRKPLKSHETLQEMAPGRRMLKKARKRAESSDRSVEKLARK
jgi:hypothetical protein